MKTTRRGIVRSAIGTVGTVLLGGTGAWAQEGAKPAAPPNTLPNNPPMLAMCLPFLDWEPQERGTLLIVAPERAVLGGRGAFRNGILEMQFDPASGEIPVRAGRNGFNLTQIAPQYKRKIAVVGSLSVVVPETMAVLRYKNLPEPNLWANVRPESRAQFLLASLSPAQWRTVMSPDGLGMSDLKRDQQAMFAALFPDTMELHRQHPPAPGETYGKFDRLTGKDVNRNAIRLRLYQDLQWSFRFQDANSGTLSMGDYAEGGNKTTLGVQFPQAVDARNDFASGEYYGSEAPVAFGVTLMETESNRAKPSDLDYDAAALNRVVPLDGAKTVGDLVARVRESTGVELYADGRYAALAVYARAAPGVGVRAGSLLKALALSVTGTFRRVASGTDGAFVLTDDRVGAGGRLTLIGEWINAAKQKLADERKKLADTARDVRVADNAPWAIDSDRVPSPALVERLRQTANGQGNQPIVPLADLPPGVREKVLLQQACWRKDAAEDTNDSHKPLRENGVILNTQTKLALVIPDFGTVPLQGDLSLTPAANEDVFGAWYAGGMYPPDTKAVLPLRLDTKRVVKRVLGVSVTSDADAREAARLAQAHGFTALLLEAEDDSAQIAARVAAASDAAPKLSVWIRTSLLRETISDAEAETLADRTILGETYRESLRRPAPPDPYNPYKRRMGASGNPPGDFVAVGEEDAIQRVRARLTALLDVLPETTALLVTDAIPPGYLPQSVGDSAVGELGYSPAMRLAFLRETGTDPVDLSPVADLHDWRWSPGFEQKQTRVRLPFFPDLGPNVQNMSINNEKATTLGAKDAYPRWYAFRAKRLAQTRNALREALLAKNPARSLFWQADQGWGGLGEWLPEATDPAPPKPAVATPKNNAVPGFFWLSHTYRPQPLNTPPMKNNERFAPQVSQQLNWIINPPKKPIAKNDTPPPQVGLLLDLTQAPFSEVKDLLSQIVFTP